VGGHFGEKKTMEQVRRVSTGITGKKTCNVFADNAFSAIGTIGENFRSKAHCSQSFRVLFLSVGTSISPDHTRSLNTDTGGY